jgi:hypothetical protein
VLRTLSFAEILGYTVGTVFLTIGIVTTLGEYVFRWWDQPWDVWGPVSARIGIMSFVIAAPASLVKGFQSEMRESPSESRQAQERLIAGQAAQTAMLREQNTTLRELTAASREQTALLREVVASFRRT